MFDFEKLNNVSSDYDESKKGISLGEYFDRKMENEEKEMRKKLEKEKSYYE